MCKGNTCGAEFALNFQLSKSLLSNGLLPFFSRMKAIIVSFFWGIHFLFNQILILYDHALTVALRKSCKYQQIVFI